MTHNDLPTFIEKIQKNGLLRSTKKIYRSKYIQKLLGINEENLTIILKQYDNILTALKKQFKDSWDILFDNNGKKISIVIYYPKMEIYSPQINMRKTIHEVFVEIPIVFYDNTLQFNSIRLFRGATSVFEKSHTYSYSHTSRYDSSNFNDLFFKKKLICMGHSEIAEKLAELNLGKQFNLPDLELFFLFLDLIIPIEDRNGVYYSIEYLNTLKEESKHRYRDVGYNIKANFNKDKIELFLSFLKHKKININDLFQINLDTNTNSLSVLPTETLYPIVKDFALNENCIGSYFVENGQKYLYNLSKNISAKKRQSEDIKEFKYFLKDCKYIIFRGEKKKPKYITQNFNSSEKDFVQAEVYVSHSEIILLIEQFKLYILHEYARKKHTGIRA